MMPEMNGQETLRKIRNYEEEKAVSDDEKVKVIMVTALEDFENITKAFKNKCEAYIVKPLEKDKIIETLDYLGLINL
jgi:two-component system chemotaxis response regulator CheY